MPNRQNLEQGRANFAFQCTENVRDNKKSYAEDYKQLVKKIPMLIKTNGLGNTLAFLLAKGKRQDNEHTQVLVDIAEWLKFDIKKNIIFKTTEQEKDLEKSGIDLSTLLVKRATELESMEYRIITIEVIAFLAWLKRFTEGLIEKKKIV